MKRHNEKTEVVSFRAPPDLIRQIDEARKPFDAGRGEWVRGVVTAHLYSAEGPAFELLTDSLDRVVLELSEVRNDVWLSLIHTLMHAADMDKTKARAIVAPLLPAHRSKSNLGD